MNGLWGTLLPLVVASALVPVQITLTVLLLRASVGTAAAWVGGMTATRLAQGVLFGLVFAGAGAASGSEDGPGAVVSVVLLVVALLFLTKAAKLLLGGDDDEDAQPPKWMKLTQSVTAGKAFLFGAGLRGRGGQALGVHAGSHRRHRRGGPGAGGVGRPVPAVRGAGGGDPDRARRLRGAGAGVVAGRCSASVSAWLERHNRVIVIVLGLVFGVWFLLKALSGLGVL